MEKQICSMDDAACRSKVVQEIKANLAREIRHELEEYFRNNPFMVEAGEHYKDHLFVATVRADLKDVKRSMLSKIGVIFALLLVGGAGAKFVIAMIKEVWP